MSRSAHAAATGTKTKQKVLRFVHKHVTSVTHTHTQTNCHTQTTCLHLDRQHVWVPKSECLAGWLTVGQLVLTKRERPHSLSSASGALFLTFAASSLHMGLCNRWSKKELDTVGKQQVSHGHSLHVKQDAHSCSFSWWNRNKAYDVHHPMVTRATQHPTPRTTRGSGDVKVYESS
jgi:hypothetical protein